MKRKGEKRTGEILLVFLVAMAIRCTVFFFVQPHPEVSLQPDSRIYLALAENLRQEGTFFPQGENTPPYLVRTPGYPLFLYLVSLLPGKGFFWIILIQVVLDSVSCALIYFFSKMLWKGIACLGGILAAFNIGMITYCHFLLNDSLFLFTFLLLGMVLFRLLRDPQWSWCVLTGFGMGLTALIRPVAMYLPVLIIPLLMATSTFRNHIHPLRVFANALTLVLTFAILVVPWAAYLHSTFGRTGLSAQSGEHLLQYVLPSVWEQSQGLPFREGLKRANRILEERAANAGLDLGKANPFDVSGLEVAIASECLRAEPWSALAKAWIAGMAKNLFAPALVDLSYLLNVERPHFFQTEGRTTLERAWNFLSGMKGWFGWAVMANIAILVLARIAQLWGLIQTIRSKPCEGLVLVLITSYFLLISGPVGYAKYRLPIEPFLIIFLAVGLKDLYERINIRRGEKQLRVIQGSSGVRS